MWISGIQQISLGLLHWDQNKTSIILQKILVAAHDSDNKNIKVPSCLALMMGISRPVDSPSQGTVVWNACPFHDVTIP